MNANEAIFFTKPYRVPRDTEYLEAALASGLTQGDGPFTARATELLRELVGGGTCLLTTSCTHALEMSALLLDLVPGDEVILPSFTFVSTVNAFALRGAVPVFVDIRPDTLNLDEKLIAEAITDRTRAIVVVHYGGVSCDMDVISSLAAEHGLAVVEDNAHGLGGSYRGAPLGSLGTMATQSFHATKNVSCGEGGSLVLNDPSYVDRAEIIREKGTNRSAFHRGMVDKYRWVDLGSSYLISDVLAALLASQLESFEHIQQRRHAIWATYDRELRDWASAIGVTTQFVPDECEHPAHLFVLLMATPEDRTAFIEHCAGRGITTPFHYVPLHDTPIGLQTGRVARSCGVTEDMSARLVRLPLHAGMTEEETERVVEAAQAFVPGR